MFCRIYIIHCKTEQSRIESDEVTYFEDEKRFEVKINFRRRLLRDLRDDTARPMAGNVPARQWVWFGVKTLRSHCWELLC